MVEATMERNEVRSKRPKYSFPKRPLLPFAFDLVFGRRRSFAHDSALVMANSPYPRRSEGFERLPEDSSFVLVMNHFDRSGLNTYHAAMAVSAAVAERRPGGEELSWLLTSEWYGRRIGPINVPVAVTRWMFARVGLVYDLVVLPRRPELVMARASSLRRVLEALKGGPVGITPEAAGSGVLIEPPPGNGLFLATLSRHGYPLYPLAVFEEGSTLVLRIGEPFGLSLDHGMTREEADRRAREESMTAVGRLLPREYWGVYAGAIERSLVDRGLDSS
jgi:hypothetical protein